MIRETRSICDLMGALDLEKITQNRIVKDGKRCYSAEFNVQRKPVAAQTNNQREGKKETVWHRYDETMRRGGDRGTKSTRWRC